MAFWITLRDQLLVIWNRWTLAQRVGFSAAALACVSAVVGTMIWAAQPDYVVIEDRLTPQRSAEIVGILNTEQIQYSLNYPGSAVSVPSSDVARARMALASILNPENESNVPAPGLFPGSPGEEEDRRLAGLEKQIERSLKRIRSIVSATVKVSRPNPSPFVTDQSPVTAAVVIEPRSGELISASTANSIMALVAGSVPGLTTANIVLTDTNGRQFGGPGMDDELAYQMNYRQQKEAHFVRIIESQLNRIRGVQASVNVAAEIDFTRRTTTSNKIDVDGKAKRSSKINTVEQTGSRISPIGTVGAASNILPDTTATGDNGKYKLEDLNEDFVFPETHEQAVTMGGDVLRLSVSAIVDLSQTKAAASDPASGGTDAADSTPVITKEDIENLIKRSVCFSETRDDQVEVILAPLNPLDVSEPATPGFIWEQWQPLMQTFTLGLAAMLAFLIGMMMLKRMKPVVITSATGRGISLEDARRLAVLSDQAKAHPEVVADIISAWLHDKKSTEAAAQSPPVAAAPNRTSPGLSTGTTAPRSGNSVPKAA